MLTINNECDSNNEKFDLSNYITIPVDRLKNINEPYRKMKIVENFVIRKLSDGSLELVNNTQPQNAKKYSTETTYFKIGNQVSSNIQLQSKNTVSRTILLQPPQKPQQTSTAIIQRKIYPKQSDVTFQCLKCSEEFNSVTLYRNHMKWHKSVKKFPCVKCSAGYNIENNLKIHMVTAHPNYDVCPICKIKFQRKASLKSHMMVHQIEEFHTCDECQAEFDTEDNLIKHMEFHAVNKTSYSNSLVCSYCKLEFKTSQEYKDHIALHITIKRTLLKGKRTRKKRNSSRFCYICKQCGKKFAKSCLLERHERIHTGEKPFVCQFCKRGFAQKGTLQIHISRHTGIKPYECILCPAKFNQKGNLRAHIDKTHTAPKGDQKMYKCSQCACIFKKIATLNGHVTKAHLNNDYPENVLDDVLKNLKLLQGDVADTVEPAKTTQTDEDHKSVVEEDINKIINGDQSLVKLTESDVNGGVRRYLVRQKKIGDVRWYFCNFCSSRFKKPSDLIRHIRVHTREKPFQCTKCNAAFSLKSTLLNHVKTHSKVANKCLYCDNTFRNTRSLNAHIRRHEKSNIPNYICILCKQVFPNLERGLLHRNEHKNEIGSTKNIIEPVLKQPLFQTAYGSLPLKPPRPKFPNTGNESPSDRPHHCTVCDARFTRLINLKRHIQFHNGDRRFKCHMCPKAFITKYRLKEHLNYHRNIRNYACKICTKRFVTASLLKRHLIVHNTHRPYMCPYCSKKFKTLLLCRTHIRNVHKLDATAAVILEDLQTDATPDAVSAEEATTVIKSNLVDQSTEGTTNPSSIQIYVQDQPEIFQTNEGDPLYQVPVQQSPILLNVPGDDGQETNTVNYQTIYVNLGDLQLQPENELGSNGVLSHLKLQNESLLTDIQDANILFQVEKPDMVDPNDIFKSNMPEDFERRIKTLPSIGEITTKTIRLNNYHEKPLKDNTDLSRNHMNVTTLLDNLQNVELDLPISIMDDDNINENGSIFTNSSDLDSEFKVNSDAVFENTHIICVNCHKVYTNMVQFQDHNCEDMDAILNNDENASASPNHEPEEGIGEKQVVPVHENLDRSDKKKEYRCDLCMKICATKQTYEKHMAATHSDQAAKSRVCKFCFKEFKKPSDLKRHLRTHTGEKPFACSMCDKKFSLKSTLDSHKRTHETLPKNIACDVCNSLFSSKSSLKVHMLLHSGQRPHACMFCEQRFRTLTTKRSHERTKHLCKTKNNHKVRVTTMLRSVAEEVVNNVNMATQNLNTCETEVPIQTNEQQLSADPLQEDITTSNIITSETLSIDPVILLEQLQNSGIIITTDSGDSTQEGVPIHLSDVTLLDFKTLDENINLEPAPVTVDEVILDHDSVKEKVVKKKEVQKVECDICHKLYASKDVLRKHKKKVHGQNKKFPCIKCDKGYDTSVELNKHIKLHTGYRPYSCHYCANSFSEEQNLKAHIKRIHQKSTVSQETTNALLNLQFDLSLNNVDALI